MGVELAGEGVAVNAQEAGCLRQIPVGGREGPDEEPTLEFALGVVVANALGHHFVHETLELVAHHPHTDSGMARAETGP